MVTFTLLLRKRHELLKASPASPTRIRTVRGSSERDSPSVHAEAAESYTNQGVSEMVVTMDIVHTPADFQSDVRCSSVRLSRRSARGFPIADRTALPDRTHAEPRRGRTERARRRAHASHGVTRIATERGPNRATRNRYRAVGESGWAIAPTQDQMPI